MLATDLDTRFVEALDLPNLETRRHDVAVDPLPSGLFDLVHARLLLGHIPNRELALRKMVEALKPGGTLLCEEGDDISTALVSPSDVASAALYSKVQDAIDHVMTERGHAADFGRRLFGQVRAFGLIDVEAEGRMLLRHAGAGAETARLTVLQLREDIISSGLATAADVASYIQLLADPGFVAMPLTLIAVWGRKPLA